MAQPKKENRILVNEADTQANFLAGAKAAYDKVVVTYGPRGRNIAIEQGFGRPVFTRDGVTVARSVYFSDRGKNMGAQAITEAAETTNRIAGDGTSATTALSYHLLKNSNQAIAAGEHPMDVSATLKKDGELLTEKLNELASPVKKGQLESVATVSSGDPLLGKLISEAIEYVGDEGGIIAEKAPVNSVEREYVDGYYLQSGFTALQSGKKELLDPSVVVCIRAIRSKSDAFELLTVVAQAMGIQAGTGQIPKVLLVGNIEGDAYASIVDAINRGVIDSVIVTPPPSFGSMAKELLEDIAIYAQCQPITGMTNMRAFDASYVGGVNRVVSTKFETTIFGDADTEDLTARIADIKDALKVEVSDIVSERLRDRVSKLEGKIALFRIGAPTDSAKEEIEYRVEDAINATRAASQHGIVAGGGVTLLELSKVEGLSKIYRTALQEVFKQLLMNANWPAEIKLQEALDAPTGYGFNLRREPVLVDVIKDGVIDPKLVAEQTIVNATDAIANVIAAGGSILFEDEEK